ncbi:MAG: hypothetical protein WD114_02125 [Phycisphaerales bacterium]
MTDQPNHHNTEQAQRAFFDALLQQRPLPIGPLLRARADDELTESQNQQLDELIADHPEAPAQIEFERALRGSCARAMAGPRCPEALAARIAATAGVASATGHAAYSADDTLPAIGHASQNTRQSGFWSDRLASRISPVLAIAAVLLLTFAGVLVWQSVEFSGNVTPVPGLSIEQASYYQRVSDFVAREHTRCADDSAAQNKLIEHDISQALAYFSAAFGQELSAPDLANARGGLSFYGGGDCHLPSTGRSGHLRFDALTDDGRTVTMSLFIAPDPGILPLDEGKTYALKSKACDDAGAQLYAWISSGIQYLLVTDAPGDLCSEMRSVMNAPEILGSL